MIVIKGDDGEAKNKGRGRPVKNSKSMIFVVPKSSAGELESDDDIDGEEEVDNVLKAEEIE
jgi:hypothetical protein